MQPEIDGSSFKWDAFTAISSVSDHVDYEEVLSYTLAGQGFVFRLDDTTSRRKIRFDHTRSIINLETKKEIAAVSYCGDDSGRVMVEVKGSHSGVCKEALEAEDFKHHYSRLDSACDFDKEGGFDEVLAIAERVRDEGKLAFRKAGDWHHGADKGRTWYLGSRSSGHMLRGYEKGRTAEFLHLGRPHLFRLEMESHYPAKFHAFTKNFTPKDVWACTGMGRKVAEAVHGLQLDPIRLNTLRPVSDAGKAGLYMLKQYRKVFEALFASQPKEVLGYVIDLAFTEADAAYKRGGSWAADSAISAVLQDALEGIPFHEMVSRADARANVPHDV